HRIETRRSAERSRRAGAEAAGPWSRVAARPRWSARPSIFTRARLAHREGPAVQCLPVESLNGLFRLRAVEILDERESPRPSRFAVHREDYLRGRRDFAEVTPQLRFGRAVREISYEQTDGQSVLLIEDERAQTTA